MSAPIITCEKLRAILDYSPDTGVFRWKHRPDYSKAWNTRYAGKVAGYEWQVGKNTYRSIRIYDWPFLAHRLAWLYMTGNWPAHGVDHRDLDGLNNRWSNLRAATKSQNGLNTKAKKNNKTGFKGVSQDRNGRCRATIQVDRRWREIGRFGSVQEAHDAYKMAVRELAGEFGRTE
ncbi:MAG: HNH endonuclease [Candidatus Hydrogenedentes bacterium]|nr:HNH endonuclease [Candidatus Hydrogenedentota bacterium]